MPTLQGLDVQQQQQQRRRIDIHWDRGLSFLKIGLRWIRGCLSRLAVVDELAIARIFTSPASSSRRR